MPSNFGRRITVAIVQTTVPDYRDEFVKRFLETVSGRYDVVLYVGDRYFGGTIRTSSFVASHPVRRRAINWQWGHLAQLQLMNYFDVLSRDVAVLELNPRILNTWFVVVARRLLGKRTVLWGHAWSRAGMNSSTDGLRALLRRSGDALLLYTHAQKTELLKKYPAMEAGRVHVATNALYPKSQIRACTPHGASLVCVGRLVVAKKPLLLLRAFASVAHRLPSDVRLHMVGDGPLRSDLEELVASSGLASRVQIHGHVADIDRLREIYSHCVFSVSPGYVGLSATQSLSFGRPVLVSRDEPHAPEIDALEEGRNAVFFRTDDEAALGDALCRAVEERELWESRFELIAAACRDVYSIESMVRGFEDAIEGRAEDGVPAI